MGGPNASANFFSAALAPGQKLKAFGYGWMQLRPFTSYKYL